MFSKIFDVAENNKTDPPVRFLSRYDKSATNIKESLLWASIGQVCSLSPKDKGESRQRLLIRRR